MSLDPRLSGRVGGGRPRSRGRRDRRVIVLQVLVLALFGTLVARLAYVQFVEGGQHRLAASSNSVRELVTNAPRGLVLDQVGRPLVSNRSALVITVDRNELARQPSGGRQVLEDLGRLLGTSGAELVERMKPCGTPGAPRQPRCWNGPPTQPVVVADRVSEEVGLSVIEQRDRLPGVRADLSPVRAYPKPYGVNAAHLVGYLGPITQKESEAAREAGDEIIPNQVGRSGIEEQFDADLRGNAGVKRVALNRHGQATSTLIDQAAQPGANVVTNIDAKVQSVTETQLRAAIDRARAAGLPADSGAAVVMDVTDGRVLALASSPSYDPQVWVGGISASDYDRMTDPNGNTPLLNRVTQGLFAPASTFKVFSAVGALESGFSSSASYPCPSAITVGGRRFTNYKEQSYGSISLARALSVSCDTVFYRLAQQMWERDGGLNPSSKAAEPISTAAKDFGLGRRTGIDLPGEYRGRVDSRESKLARYEELKDEYCRRAQEGYPEEKDRKHAELLRSYARDYCAEGSQFRAGDALNASIGQGETVVTPLQIATAYSALANGGTLWQPQIVRAVTNRDGSVVREFSPRRTGTVAASKSALSYVRSALADAPVAGTAAGPFRGFPLREVPIAAKTGTGEVVGKANTSWFASFAPADSPRYAVVFMVSQGGTGSETSGPSVRA
ncbi:MAG: penicillin-binding protein 2, partial [Candidatus Nanopelagicales bacterium]|nr:penicillin-binding protein 2 [Candidatus Nanopelagicales bacterium]